MGEHPNPSPNPNPHPAFQWGELLASRHCEPARIAPPPPPAPRSYVKPYDVVALMTVLPFCQHAFDGYGQRVAAAVREAQDSPPPRGSSGEWPSTVAAQVEPQSRCGSRSSSKAALPKDSARGRFAWASAKPHPPACHLLLLTPEDEIASSHVLNLLRDTYHEVHFLVFYFLFIFYAYHC